MSEIKVNSIKGVAASTAALTINNTDGTCTANLTNRTNKNLVINGACLIAQRGTSSTTSGYGSVDRFKIISSGVDEAPTQAQVDVASGTTPYTLGFRKALKVTNGNQTSGLGTTDRIEIIYNIEAQDIANSGWNYLSSSSYITLQFWIKSSVAQNFYGRLLTSSGTDYNYPFETGSLSADTWTKITKTIPGNSNITVDNTNGDGLRISFYPGLGTDYTGSVSLNAWAAYASATRVPDTTSTWYTTNDATFEITGVQLEVSDHATDFEHRSFSQELLLCQRYYYKQATVFYGFFGYGTNSSTNMMGNLIQPCVMRTQPTVTMSAGSYWASGPVAGGSGPFYSYAYGTTSSSNGPNLLNYELSAEL